jgi:RimJ/RimL family protein N-acetyltransferase
MGPSNPRRRNSPKPNGKRGKPKRVFFRGVRESQLRPRQLRLFETTQKPLVERVKIVKMPRKMMALLGKSPVAELKFERRTHKAKGKLLPYLHITHLFVMNENENRKGVGRRLLESFLLRIKQIPKHKLPYPFITMDIDSENTRMIATAEKAGFRKVGQSRHGDYGTDDVMFHFRISF